MLKMHCLILFTIIILFSLEMILANPFGTTRENTEKSGDVKLEEFPPKGGFSRETEILKRKARCFWFPDYGYGYGPGPMPFGPPVPPMGFGPMGPYEFGGGPGPYFRREDPIPSYDPARQPKIVV